MTLDASSNPIWVLWPECLMVACAALWLVGMRTVAREGSINSTHVRLLSLLGLFVTGCTILLGLSPSIYSIIAIPLIPAPFGFGAFLFRPGLISRWNRFRIYLTICVVVSALAWITQFIWLYAL